MPTHARAEYAPKHARPSRAAGRLVVLATGGAAAAVGGVLSAPPAHASTQGDQVVSVASRYVGDPYLWGGTSPAGFDCSGYVQYVFHQVGVQLPRTTNEQYAAVPHLGADQKQPGDIMFLPDSSGSIYHEGIYAGQNSWWVSSHTGTVVSLQTIWTSNYLVGRATTGGGAPGSAQPVLQLGSTGPAVVLLQRRIGAAPDGDFGPLTRQAVQTAQSDHGLNPDGVVGPLTRAALGL